MLRTTVIEGKEVLLHLDFTNSIICSIQLTYVLLTMFVIVKYVSRITYYFEFTQLLSLDCLLSRSMLGQINTM